MPGSSHHCSRPVQQIAHQLLLGSLLRYQKAGVFFPSAHSGHPHAGRTTQRKTPQVGTGLDRPDAWRGCASLCPHLWGFSSPYTRASLRIPHCTTKKSRGATGFCWPRNSPRAGGDYATRQTRQPSATLRTVNLRPVLIAAQHACPAMLLEGATNDSPISRVRQGHFGTAPPLGAGIGTSLSVFMSGYYRTNYAMSTKNSC